METKENKRDRSLLVYWMIIGVGIGIALGASTQEWMVSLSSGTIMGAGMAFAATKPGLH